MQAAHDLILLGGALGLVSIFAGVISARLGAPLLLVFLILGMLAGEDGPGGIVFDDFPAAYLVGSVALAVILFEGGLKVTREMVALAAGPAALLATVGVLATAGITAIAVRLFTGIGWPEALLAGAVVAPTDAAAVAVLLRGNGLAVPHRVMALLELESGVNDPVSVFLVILLTGIVQHAGDWQLPQAAMLFLREMGGGAALGIGGGMAMLLLLRRLALPLSLFPILALCFVMALFGLAQRLETSGFLAVFLTAVVVGWQDVEARLAIQRFFEALAWLAQITLFLLLGLLVTPHELRHLVTPVLGTALVLIVVARPLSVAACLLPFRYTPREITFAAWVGLRGGVPIYLTIIPVLAGLPRSEVLFSATFVIVIASLIVQGWTVAFAARRLRFAG